MQQRVKGSYRKNQHALSPKGDETHQKDWLSWLPSEQWAQWVSPSYLRAHRKDNNVWVKDPHCNAVKLLPYTFLKLQRGEKNKVNIQMHLCSLIEKYFSNKIQWNQKPQKSLYPATVYKVCQSSADISLRLPFMGFLFVLLMWNISEPQNYKDRKSVV